MHCSVAGPVGGAHGLYEGVKFPRLAPEIKRVPKRWNETGFFLLRIVLMLFLGATLALIPYEEHGSVET